MTQRPLQGAFLIPPVLPVVLIDAILGVVEFFSREVQPADDALLAMADGLGSQIGQFTERTRFEEQLLKLSRAVEQSASLVIIADAAGRIEYVNPKFTQVTGYASAEVLGQNPRILKSGETPPREYQRLWEAITSGGEWRGEFHNKKKDGGLYWASESISPVRNPQGIITHFVAIQDDITDLKEAQRRTLLAERLAAIGQMMAGLAHESRNALQRGQACLEMLSRRLTDRWPSTSWPASKRPRTICIACTRRSAPMQPPSSSSAGGAPSATSCTRPGPA